MKVFAYIFVGCCLLSSCSFQKKSTVVSTSDFTKIGFSEHITNVFDLNKNYLYYQAYKGDIVKWNRQTKQEEWRYSNPSKYPAISYLTTDSLIYFSEWGGSPILALNREGKIELELRDGLFDYSNTFIKDTNGILVSGVNGISKVNFSRKKIDWKTKCFSTSTKCNLSIADAGNSIIVGGLGDSLSFDYDNILSIDKSSGKKNWGYRLKGEVIAGMTANTNQVFVGIEVPSSKDKKYNDANYIICMDRQSGKLLWEQKYDFTFGSNLLLKEDTLYFNGSEMLYSVNTESGQLNWSKKIPILIDILGVYKGSIVLKRTDGIDLINPFNGSLQREIKAVINAGPWFLENALCYFSNNDLFISQF